MAVDRSAEVRTTCPYCGVGCGVLAKVAADGDGRRPRRSRPSGQFRPAVLEGLGARRDASASTAGCSIPRSAASAPAGTTALDLVAATLRRDHRRARPGLRSPSTSPGQLLTEDYYVANKLMKGFIGSANIDTNSRLCMASSVAGHRRAFGADIVPGTYEDLELADLVVLVGSNLAWCHPVLYQRLVAAQGRAAGDADRADRSAPHRRPPTSPTCISPSQPDGDVALFNGLLAHLARQRRARPRLSSRRTRSGFEAALASPRRCSTLPASPRRPGSTQADVARFYRAVRRDRADRHRLQPGRQPVGARHRQGQRHHQLPSGDRPHRQAGHGAVLGHRPAQRHGRARGRRPGQQLAAHMDFEDPGASRPRRAASGTRRASPTQPGLKAVDMFEAVADGRIKALWIMATNPVDQHARRRRACEAALKACPFVVVSDVHGRHRHRSATPMCCCPPPPGARRTARSPIPSGASRASAPFLPPPGEARPDWWIICRGRASAWASPTPSPTRRRPRSSPSMRRCRPSRTTARATSTSARMCRHRRDRPTKRSRLPFQWPRPGC